MTKINLLNQNIHYQQFGDEGPPILFIHGSLTSNLVWLETQQNLADFYQTYSLDLIGMGQSDKPLNNWDYTFENDAKIIAGFLDSLNIDRITICGNDWGGGIALTFAQNYPDRVQRLMVFNPTVYDHWPSVETEYFGNLAKADDNWWQQNHYEVQYKLSHLLKTMVIDPSFFTNLTIRPFLNAYRSNNYSQKGNFGQPEIEALKALAKRCETIDPQWTINLQLENIITPTLVAWGEDDIYADPLGMYMLKDDLSGPVRTHLLQDAGHLCMIDKPIEVTELIDDFMSEWQASQAAEAA